MVAKERNVVVLHQTLAMVPLYLVEFMMGIGIGWLAPMLHQLKESPDAAFTSEDCAWIAALHYASRGVVSLVAAAMIDRLGRNVFFIFASIICFFMWIMVYSSFNVYVHFVVRILFGFAVGFHDMAAERSYWKSLQNEHHCSPSNETETRRELRRFRSVVEGRVCGIYIGENCSPTLRGTFSGFFLAAFYLGEVVEFVLAAFLSYERLAVMNCVFGLITVLSTFFLTEPAHYLIMKGHLAKAEKNYGWLHDVQNPTTKHEFEDIKEYVLEEKSRALSWKMLRSREVYKSLRITLLMHFFCYVCGYSAVNSFVTIALAGSEGMSNTHLTIFFGLVLFSTITLSSPFMDKFNRRTLYLCTNAIIIIIHAATAALYYASTMYEVMYFRWILFTLLTTFMTVHGMFIFPVTTVVRGELLPQNFKAIGSSLAGIFGSVGGFFGAKIFLPISDSLGTHTNFLLFSCISVIMFLYVYFDLPETKGKTLPDIQRELKGGSKNTQDAVIA